MTLPVPQIADRATRDRALAHLRAQGVLLPTFAQLAEPRTIPARVLAALHDVDPDAPHPLNLFRVHWWNDEGRRGLAAVPAHLELPRELTGVQARIVLALGERFPMIGAHKVLAAYACLAPRLVSGQIDPTAQRAVWPSTGNYCRGGVAISRILGCRGVAVLPAGMSAERFEWLGRWVSDPSDVIRTPGTESNVKEIYDECARLARDPSCVIFNQFREFPNYVAHALCTGQALGRLYEHLTHGRNDARLFAFVAATGSAGTLGAGDTLAERYGARTVAVEAAECPTLLDNGFGEHNIQGIGDKHVPLIHNVLATDAVAAVSDAATDSLHLLLQTEAGRGYLARRKRVPAAFLARTRSLGLSGLCNALAAIQLARHFELGPDDVVLTVATDGAAMYRSEIERIQRKRFPTGFDELCAAEAFGQHLAGPSARLRELTRDERVRIFNLGYFTWVEQQGVELADFVARRRQTFWRDLRALAPAWDAALEEANANTGAAERL